MTAVTTREQGYTGLSNEIVRHTTTSTLAQVTTAGYWNNQQVSSGQPAVTQQDLILITYSYGNSSLQATGLFNVSIGANGVVTLSLGEVDVVTPTIANHIATYTNTSGTLSEDPATAISGGNIQAGLSGTAGTLSSFPATASKGSLVLAAVANTGNTTTTFSNVAMGQASVISSPDPANAVGRFLVGATATPFVSGNFPQNSGTGGLMVDSGVSVASLSGAVTQLGKLYNVSVTLNQTQMAAAYATPAQLIANPLASQMILLIATQVYTASTGNTAYATGTAPIIQYSSGGTNGAHGAGTIATASGLVAGDITASTSQVRNLLQLATGAQTGLSGLGIYFSNATGAYTGGTGTNVTFTLTYLLLTATV